MNCAERYQWACKNPSDIALHVPILHEYGLRCKSITEFGVRGGVSTSAWLMAAPENLVCYDQNRPECLPELRSIAAEQGTSLEFIQTNTAYASIAPTDLLFLDTLHTGEHLSCELANHPRVSKYLIFHDTETNGWDGEGGGYGLKKALIEFLLANTGWAIDYHSKECNGLTILKRVSP